MFKEHFCSITWTSVQRSQHGSNKPTESEERPIEIEIEMDIQVKKGERKKTKEKKEHIPIPQNSGFPTNIFSVKPSHNIEFVLCFFFLK